MRRPVERVGGRARRHPAAAAVAAQWRRWRLQREAAHVRTPHGTQRARKADHRRDGGPLTSLSGSEGVVYVCSKGLLTQSKPILLSQSCAGLVERFVWEPGRVTHMARPA